VPFNRVEELTVTVDDEPRHTLAADVLKLETSGCAFTVKAAVFPDDTVELQAVAVTAIEVIVTVVEPGFDKVGVANVPLPLANVSDAVRPVPVLAPVRL